MSAQVVFPRFVDTQDLPADAVLEQSKGWLKSAIVLGWDHNDEVYALSSLASGIDALWLLQTAIHRLMHAQQTGEA